MKRKLAHGFCANCGVDETKTSLWRTGIDRERLCCGLYVQTHGTPRPTTHFNQRKGKAKEGASRESTPSRTPRTSPKFVPTPLPPISAPLSSSSSTSSDSLEPSPPIAHAVPVATSVPGRARQRQPRRPHVSAEGSDTDGGSTSRGHSRVRLPRAPPRPRSAPPTKHRSRFHSPSIDIFRTDKGTAPAIMSDVEKLRAAEDVMIREPATDVLSQGSWYRVPEKTIRLDFWSKIGLGPGAAAEGSSSNMMRTSSAPSYTPRMNVFTPQETMSDSFSPTSTVDDTFGTSGGDFSDSENTNGKRGRYYGPLFNVRQVAAQVAAEKKAGPRSRGSSPSGLDVGNMRIASRRTSEQHPSSQPPSRPGSLPPSSAPTSPEEALLGGAAHMPESFIPNPHITYPGQLSPDRAHAIPTSSSADGLAAKRMRSSSPSSSLQIHPPSPSAAIPVSHPSPVHHSAVVASTSSVQKIARAGSPLRFSSSASALQHPPPLPKSGLGVESVPSDERSVMKDDDDAEDVFGGGGVIVPPAAEEEGSNVLSGDVKMSA